jgi:undecaprenyl-diphosphatase
MTTFQALVLGIVQGLSEFLPISSSAHLVLVPWALHWPDPGLSFDVALHLGTLIAVLWYFRAEWARLAGAAVKLASRGGRPAAGDAGVEERRVWYLIIATVPGAIAGKLLERQADEAFRSPLLIAATLMVMGVLLWVVDIRARRTRPLSALTARDALVMGAAQILALVPGVSRSGSTITAGRALGFDRDSAAVFSFLMSMPIIAGAALLKVPHLLASGSPGLPLAVGITASAVSGWLAIAVVLRYVKTHSYGAFAVYRLLLGAAVLALAAARNAHA